jgi:hypothetical protein
MEKREEYNSVMNFMVDDVLSVCKHAYFVSEAWWNDWLKYMDSGLDSIDRPKAMKNFQCLSSFNITEKNYKLIHPGAWEILKKSYDYRPEIIVFINDKQPDLNPINVYIYTENKKYEVLLASRKMSVQDLKEYIIQTYFWGLVQGYLEFNKKKLEDESQSLESVGIQSNSNLYIREYGYIGESVNESKEKNHSGYRESKVIYEEFMEPDPTPSVIANEIPEEKALEMVQEALELGFFDLKKLSFQQIRENLAEFERTEYEF